MIIAMTGVPGSGKSLHAATIIYKKLTSDMESPVIANFPINKNICNSLNFTHKDNQTLTTEFLVWFSRMWFSDHEFKEGAISLFIDEAQILFNTRTSIGTRLETSERLKWVEFMSQHRKYGYNIYLITQDVKFIDKQFRFLIEQECHHTNFANMGLPGFFLRLRYGGAKHLATWRYFGVKDILYTQAIKGKPHIYDLYNSYGIFAKMGDK